jgi:hypothetical protein
MATMYRY